MNQTLAMRLGRVRSGNIHAILIKYSVVFRLVSIFGLFMAWNEIQNHINVILSFISLFLFVFIWFLIVWRSFYLVHFDYMIFVLTGGYKWIGLSINLQTANYVERRNIIFSSDGNFVFNLFSPSFMLRYSEDFGAWKDLWISKLIETNKMGKNNDKIVCLNAHIRTNTCESRKTFYGNKINSIENIHMNFRLSPPSSLSHRTILDQMIHIHWDI